jgi:transketolase
MSSETPTAPDHRRSGDTTPVETLLELGRRFRIDAIRMADRAGSGHPTSSMSAADLVAVLVADHLAIDRYHPDVVGNDHLLFSKGHASPLLYAALRAIGVLAAEDLDGYRRHGHPLEGHPTPLVPGVPAATGSLGLGLPIGVGMALADRDLEGNDARTWVLCGDSEMAEGSMWEAIEHAGWARLANLVAIVDVNRLGQTGSTRHGWDVEPYRRRFEAVGWHTIEIDGHDPVAIDAAYTAARNADRPTAVLARTRKGSGVAETDDAPGKHGRPLDDPEAAIAELGGDGHVSVVPRSPRFVDPARTPATQRDTGLEVDLPRWERGELVATRDAFGAALVALGHRRDDIVALDAEVGDSTRLAAFGEAFGDRHFQLYIAEQLLFSVAIGMQVTGWRPVASTFAAFCTRGHDVLRMATIGRASMTVVGSHAGVSIGPDGPSQMGLEDLAMMRALHDSTVVHPCDANQTAALLDALVDLVGVTYLRTARGETPVIYGPEEAFPIGGSRVLRASDDDLATVVAAGVTVHEALAAAHELADRGVDVRVIDAYSVKPIDATTLRRAAAATGRVVVVEDHRPEGGLGEAVLSALAGEVGGCVFGHLAVRTMPGSATPAEQRADAGIDAPAIVAEVDRLLR